MNVPINKSVTLGAFIDNGSTKSGFWNYDAVNSNCQMFCRDLLSGSGLLTSELNSFIMQNAEKLLENSPLTRTVAKTVTDIGQKLRILIGGKARN